MFGQSVFGSTPLGVSFEAGASFDSGGASAHASTSSGGGHSGGNQGTLGGSGALQIKQNMPVSPPVNGMTTQTCLYDTKTGVLDCPYPTNGPLPPAAKLSINPAILKLFPQMQQRQAMAPAYPQPAAAKPFPWLLVGLGVLVLGGAGYWYYTKQKA